MECQRHSNLDHGFGNIKTAHCCFRTGVTAYDKKPIFTSEMLVYDGKYYIIGEEHKEFVPDKMSDPDYYILTLAAVARELYLQNRTTAKVYLAVGLPLTWVSEQRDSFKAYLLQNEAVDFNYKGTDYHVEFAGASVYPQGFAAVAGIVKRFQGLHMLPRFMTACYLLLTVTLQPLARDNRDNCDDLHDTSVGCHGCLYHGRPSAML